MKKKIARLLSALLCLMLITPCALAQDLSLDSAVGAYVDAYDELRFTAGVQFETLTPYGEDTVSMMNALLSHLSISAVAGKETSSVQVQLAGDSVASFHERGTDMTTSLLPRRVLTSPSGLNALAPVKQEPGFDFFAAIAEAEACYQELTDAILPYAEQKKANYSIKNVGSSRWSRIARLTPEQADVIGPLIAQVLGCGMNEAFRDQLRGMTYQKGFIVGLYQTAENGDDLAVYIKGDVTFPDGVKRSISYQWAFAVRDDGTRVDSYKFDMTKAKAPRDNRQISGFFKRRSDSSLLLDGESKAIIRDPETNLVHTATLTCDLSGKEDQDARTIGGSMSHALRVSDGDKGSTDTLTITPSLRLTAAEDGVALITGKADVQKTTGNTTHLKAVITFDEEAAFDYLDMESSGALYAVTDMPQSSLTQNLYPAKDEDYLVGAPPIGFASYEVPDETIVVDLDQATEEELSALEQELLQNLAGGLIKTALKLPDEAAALIRDGLTDADFAALTAE